MWRIERQIFTSFPKNSFFIPSLDYRYLNLKVHKAFSSGRQRRLLLTRRTLGVKLRHSTNLARWSASCEKRQKGSSRDSEADLLDITYYKYWSLAYRFERNQDVKYRCSWFEYLNQVLPSKVSHLSVPAESFLNGISWKVNIAYGTVPPHSLRTVCGYVQPQSPNFKTESL